MAKTSSVGSGRFSLEMRVAGSESEWQSAQGNRKYDTRAQAVKDAQAVYNLLGNTFEFRTVVSEIEVITLEELNHKRTRTMKEKTAEIAPAEMAPKSAKARASAE
jgi:hypothetical protein